jgi:hypothetical protein
MEDPNKNILNMLDLFHTQQQISPLAQNLTNQMINTDAIH